MPPDNTTSRPPLLICELLAVPPAETNRPPFVPPSWLPVLSTIVLRANPPEETTNLPVPESVVPEAVPPDDTISKPLVAPVPKTESEMVVPPDETTNAPPAL